MRGVWIRIIFLLAIVFAAVYLGADLRAHTGREGMSGGNQGPGTRVYKRAVHNEDRLNSTETKIAGMERGKAMIVDLSGAHQANLKNLNQVNDKLKQISNKNVPASKSMKLTAAQKKTGQDAKDGKAVGPDGS